MRGSRVAHLLGVVLTVLLGLGLASCGGGGASSSGATAPQAAAVDGRAPSLEAYRLSAGDRVKVTVFRHEDLSLESELDGQGNLSMPLIDEVAAWNLTVRELEALIEKKYRDDGYLRDPEISIEVLNYRPFFILGEVNNPGSYPYSAGMTVIRAVAEAGGFSYRADQDDIVIERGGEAGERIAATVTTPVIPGDIITVYERFF